MQLFCAIPVTIDFLFSFCNFVTILQIIFLAYFYDDEINLPTYLCTYLAPTFGFNAHHHKINCSLAIDLIFHCSRTEETTCIIGTVSFILVGLPSPFNSAVNGRKVSQCLATTFTNTCRPFFAEWITQKLQAENFCNH